MTVTSTELIAELKNQSNQAYKSATQLYELTLESLNLKTTPESWSILECLEHLNLYGDYYLNVIEDRMKTSKIPPQSRFESGWLGNYFANSMLEKNGKISKMKSPKDKIPSTSNLNVNTIDRFLAQNKKLQELLDLATLKNLNKIKIPISLSKYISIRLGDTLRFYVIHIERHMAQAKRNIS